MTTRIVTLALILFATLIAAESAQVNLGVNVVDAPTRLVQSATIVQKTQSATFLCTYLGPSGAVPNPDCFVVLDGKPHKTDRIGSWTTTSIIGGVHTWFCECSAKGFANVAGEKEEFFINAPVVKAPEQNSSERDNALGSIMLAEIAIGQAGNASFVDTAQTNLEMAREAYALGQYPLAARLAENARNSLLTKSPRPGMFDALSGSFTYVIGGLLLVAGIAGFIAVYVTRKPKKEEPSYHFR